VKLIGEKTLLGSRSTNKLKTGAAERDGVTRETDGA